MDDEDIITSTSPSYGSHTRTLPTVTETAPAVEADDIHTANNPLKTTYSTTPATGRRGSVLDNYSRDLGLGTRATTESMASLPATLLDAATWPGRAGLRLMGAEVDAPSTMLEHTLDYTGLPKPANQTEQKISNMVKGGGAMLASLGVGAIPRLAASLPSLLRPFIAAPTPSSAPLAASQIVAGGVGAGVGDAAADSGMVPEFLKPTARLLGNIAGAGATNVATGLAGTARNAYNGVINPTVEALQRLGIIPRTMGAVSQNPGVHETEAAFSGVPMASGRLQPAQSQMVDQFGNAVERTARSLENLAGPRMATAQAAGERVQTLLHDWRENTWPAEQTAIWQPLSQRMAGASVDPSGLRAALERGARDPALNSLPEVQRAFIQDRLQTWLNALNADVPRGQSMSWEQAMALKRRIGDEMGRPTITSDVGGTALKNVYGSIAGDMRTTAAQHGQAGLFDQANAATIAGHQFINGTVVKAVKANNLAQETIRSDDAAGALLRDNTALQQLRQRVPEAADALAAYNLRHMAEAKPSSQGDVSTGTFETNLRKQRQTDPEGHAALYTDPAAAQDVRDLETVGNQFRNVEKNMNTSRTGKTGVILGLGGGMGAGAASGYASGGIPGAITGALSVLGPSLAVPYGVGKVLTNPTAIRMSGAVPGPRPPLDAKVAGLLGYLANQ